jgi:ribosomal protein S18 acetylase RimI-like enzyme
MTVTPIPGLSDQVRKASEADVPAVASVLARAFHDDPVFSWGYPDGDERRARLPGIFSAFAEALAPHDETYVAGDVTGAALWVPPGREPVGGEHAATFEERLAAAAGPGADRLFEVMQLVDDHHPNGSFYFLFFLGVVPADQGRGLGSALLEGALRRCDREGARAYLDATSPDNKRLYERHGFRAGAGYAPAGGPPLWPMWREPQSSRS